MQRKNLSGEKLINFQNRNGCGFKIQDKPRQKVGFINFHSCYCDHLHPSFNHLMYLYENFNKGLLPYSGSLTDQPNHLLDIFKLFDRLKAELEQELREKQKE